MARNLLNVADVLDGVLDQRHLGVFRILDDVVDDEHLRVRQRGDHPPDVFVRRRDDLHVALRHADEFVDQEQVRRFRDGDGQHVANAEQRQDEVLFDEFARQDVDDLQVHVPGVELGVGDAVLHRQALDDLVLGAVLQFDEDFAQQALRTDLVLLRKGRLQLVDGQVAVLHQQVAESF